MRFGNVVTSETGDQGPSSEAVRAPNLHFQQLAYLREVARRGSLSRAAEALNVSQPALSQAIAELERRLDVPLFERAGRGRRPTPAGEEVIRFSEQVLAAAQALAERLASFRHGERGPLSVGMIDAASLYVLPDVVRRFRAAFPNVDLKLAVATSGELLRRLRAFALDLVFVVGPVEAPDLVSAEVLREPLFVYGPAVDRFDPREARWVLYPEGSRTRAIIDAAFAGRGWQPEVALESGNPQVLRQMVVMGLGWSVLPQAIAESDGRADGLRRGARLAERPLHVVRRRTSPPDPRAEAFLNLAIPS